MAVATQGQGVVNQHFGHAKEFLIYEASPEGVRFIGHRKAEQYCAGDTTCGDGESTIDITIRAIADCEAMISAKVGFGPWEKLEAAGVVPNSDYAYEPIEDAVVGVYREMYDAGRLAAADDQQLTA